MTKIEAIERGMSRDSFISAFLNNNTTRAKLSDEYDNLKRTLNNTSSSYSANAPNQGNVDTSINSNFLSNLGSALIRSNQGEFGGEFIKFDESFKKLQSMFNGTFDLKQEVNDILINGAETYYTQQRDLLYKVNQELGMSGELSRNFRMEITKGAVEAKQYGIEFNDVKDAVSTIVESSGKFKLLSSEEIAKMAQISRLTGKYVDDLSKMVPNFERIGLGIGDMTKIIERNTKSSLELGLNMRSITNIVNQNMEKINKYGFKDGVEGLNRMAQKSVELRLNMEEVFNFAEKVFDPETALNTVANLQMIGGAIGDLNDPLKLMYMVTNDVEGLQKSIMDASKSLATYNSEQGRFEVTGANIRRARAMADTMGIQYEELVKTATAAQERVLASTELMASGFQFKDEKDKEFLTNLAKMEGGEMKISIPEGLRDQFQNVKDGQVALGEMTGEQIQILLDQKEAFKKMTTEDIVKEQVTILDSISFNMTYIRELLKERLGSGIEDIVYKRMGLDPIELKRTMKEYQDIAGSGIKEGSKQIKGWIDTLYDVASGKMKENKSEKVNASELLKKESLVKSETTSSTSTVNENVTLTIKSGDAFTDAISREWVRQSQLDPRGYLNKNVKKSS